MKQGGGGVMMWEKGTRDKWSDISGGKVKTRYSLFNLGVKHSVYFGYISEISCKNSKLFFLYYFGYLPKLLTRQSTSLLRYISDISPKF